MILVDPAIWRWRGRRWAHLVSDTSHEELHHFAARLGLRRIWFQGDHYDIPSDMREEALRLGAVAVDSRELVLRITAAGLRKRRTSTPLVPDTVEAQAALAAHAPAAALIGSAADEVSSGRHSTGYAPGAPAWMDLVTSEPAAALAFYGALFGWDFDIGGPEDGRYTLCRLKGRAVAGLNGTPAPEGIAPAWTTYLADADVDSAAGRITAAGGRLVVGPAGAGPYGRVVVAVDPTGAIFGLWQAGTLRGAEAVDEPGAPTWTELHTVDLDTTEAFYRAVCGHSFQAVDPRPDRAGYRTFHVAGRPAGGVRLVPAEGATASRWVPYIGVEDAAAAVAAAVAAGGRIEQPLEESPFGRWVTIADPQGARLTLVEIATSGGPSRALAPG